MPNIIDSTVVANAYQTSASARPQRLSNGWIVTCAMNGAVNFNFYVSKDNGLTFSPLCYWTTGQALGGFSIASYGTKVYLLAFKTGANQVALMFDALTVTNTELPNWTTVDNATSGNGTGCSLVIDSTGTFIHGTWTCKTATYPNSFNIRYAKGTISAVDGSVVWGTVTMVSSNTSGGDFTTPCIVCDKSNSPVIITKLSGAGAYNTIQGFIYSGGSWIGKVVYTTSEQTYAQSSPSAIFVPQSINGLVNGRIWVTWHGADATDATYGNIRVSYSDDNGVTWSTMQKLTSGNTFNRLAPSITANKNNEIYILYTEYNTGSVYKLYHNKTSWGSSTQVLATSTNNLTNVSTLYDSKFDFISPLFIYQNISKVGFYGSWTVTTISVTQGSIGSKSDKTNLLSYAITTDGTMSTITESVNGVTVGTKTATSGQSLIAGLSQAQWDSIKYGKYKDTTGGLNTLTITMGTDTWTYTFDKRLATTDDITSAMKAVQDSQSTMLPSIKAKLGSAIRSKGGSVNDSDAFDIMVSAIANSSSKKWASGVSSSVYYSSSASKVTVSGLTFAPSIILVSSVGSNVGWAVMYKNSKMFNYDQAFGNNYNSSTEFTSSGTYAIDGFSAFVKNGTAGVQYDWIAIE